eukprot:2842512-Amphidinium_carterae.5
MLIPGDEGVEHHAQYEEVIFMTEADRIMMDTCAAASVEMEVDQGSLGVTSPGETRSPEIHWELLTQNEQGAPGVTSTGATMETGIQWEPATPEESMELSASYIRQMAANTLDMIKEQEAVLLVWKNWLPLLEEGTDDYKAMQSQIEVVEQMLEHYRLALQLAHRHAPAPLPIHETKT